MAAPSFFAKLLEGDVSDIVVEEIEGDRNCIVSESFKISPTEGYVRAPSSGAIRKQRWRLISDNRRAEMDRANERARNRRQNETEQERAQRRARQNANARRARLARSNFVQSQGMADVQNVTVSGTKRIYKRRHNITRYVVHEYIDSIHAGDGQEVEGRSYRIVKSNNTVQQISPSVDPDLEIQID